MSVEGKWKLPPLLGEGRGGVIECGGERGPGRGVIFRIHPPWMQVQAAEMQLQPLSFEQAPVPEYICNINKPKRIKQ